MNDAIKQILELAVHAPSGENCQPWSFGMRANQVNLYNIPERDNSLYNWGQRGSYVAHGALIENINIAASTLGYVSTIILFPYPNDQNLVAQITFEQIAPKEHPLYPFIKQRTTNRKPYKDFVLTAAHRKELSQIAQESKRGKLIFVEDPKKKKVIAQAAAGNEKILFENPQMHKFFYDHITWTEREDEEKKIGFYIKTFELPPPAEKMFKLAKNWRILQILNRIGFSKFIVKQNAKIYASCSAIGAIVIPSNSAEDFVLAGRLLQRVWLTVTKMGLSLQPLTGILFLMQRIMVNEANQLSASHQDFIKEQYHQIRDSFGVADEIIATMFRIGDGGLPTVRALRLKPPITTLP